LEEDDSVTFVLFVTTCLTLEIATRQNSENKSTPSSPLPHIEQHVLWKMRVHGIHRPVVHRVVAWRFVEEDI
jgi:hypothetical protein